MRSVVHCMAGSEDSVPSYHEGGVRFRERRPSLSDPNTAVLGWKQTRDDQG